MPESSLKRGGNAAGFVCAARTIGLLMERRTTQLPVWKGQAAIDRGARTIDVTVQADDSCASRKTEEKGLKRSLKVAQHVRRSDRMQDAESWKMWRKLNSRRRSGYKNGSNKE